jgi:hypothetical protein
MQVVRRIVQRSHANITRRFSASLNHCQKLETPIILSDNGKRIVLEDEQDTVKLVTQFMDEEQRKKKEKDEQFFKIMDQYLQDPELTPQKGDLEAIQKQIRESSVQALSDESSKWGRQTTPLFTRDDRNQRFYRSVAIENYDFEGKTGYIGMLIFYIN